MQCLDTLCDMVDSSVELIANSRMPSKLRRQVLGRGGTSLAAFDFARFPYAD